MLRRFATAVFFMIVLSVLRAEAYTVVMKNGKVIKGTLVSETADGIVFKDEQGLQYSLKKSALDLAKMEEANKPPAPPQPPTESPQTQTQTQASAAKKSARTYTDADVTRLGGANAGDLLGVESTGDPYVDALHSAAAVIDDLLGKYQSMAAQIIAAYEIAVSTGGDGSAAMRKYLGGQTAGVILHGIDADLARLNSLRNQLSGQSDEKSGSLQTFDDALKLIPDMRAMLVSPKVLSSTADFQNRVNEMSTQLSTLGEKLQSVGPKAPAPAQEQAAPEPAEQPVGEPPPDQKPPDDSVPH